MFKILGVVMCLGGIAFGLYAGLWWAFIGGILDIINQIRAPELSVVAVVIGVVKIVFASLVGWVSAALLLIPGMALLSK